MLRLDDGLSLGLVRRASPAPQEAAPLGRLGRGRLNAVIPRAIPGVEVLLKVIALPVWRRAVVILEMPVRLVSRLVRVSGLGSAVESQPTTQRFAADRPQCLSFESLDLRWISSACAL
jgi:hypothetical protein